ncbi:hypothetical protein ABZ318_28255 [Streptomyces sp. NPDC006197]|uniref:hypothetical protein n=1 Tax=Streptomyces sp. NPDC006197 TaxID=3156685 RepID=UPI0033ADB999
MQPPQDGAGGVAPFVEDGEQVVGVAQELRDRADEFLGRVRQEPVELRRAPAARGG